jgi:hypothetical protein
MEHFVLGSRFYFSRLPKIEQEIYRQIYDSWVTGGTLAKVIIPGTDFTLPSGKPLIKLIEFITNDNPHLFHLETTQFWFRRMGPLVTIDAEHVYTPAQYQQVYRALIRRVDQLVKAANQFRTDYEKVRFLHDYLVKNVVYDYGEKNPRSQREIHTIVGCLLGGRCVCDGYARSFRLLCDQLRISCIVGTGVGGKDEDTENHAWNFVKLNGKVYHMDVTWDSNHYVAGSPFIDKYFLRGDSVFSKDHSWDKTLYAPIPQDYPRDYPILVTKYQLEEYLCQQFRKGNRQIVAYLDPTFPGMDVLGRMLKKIYERNVGVFIGVQGWRYTFDENEHAAIVIYE